MPFGAGVGSAIGLLEAESRIDVSATRVMQLDAGSGPAIAALYANLEARANVDVARLGANKTPRWSRYAYMRYVGQGFEVHVDLPSGPIDDSFGLRAIESFNEAYLRKHRFLDADATVEVVDWTLVASVAGDAEAQASAASRTVHTKAGEARPKASRQAWFPELGGFVTTRVVDRQAMLADALIEGPAIIEDPDSTAVILPGDRARVSDAGHLIIDIGASQEARPA